MPADKDEEVFEVVDDDNEVINREQRGTCHKQGLCHRAVYCLVFNRNGQLLIQQRSSRKKIGPGQWDLSVAEHLQPGESYKEAVVRGLQEELGIDIRPEDLVGPLNPPHQRVLSIPGLIKDVEFVTTYSLRDWEGKLKIDEDEVQATRWINLAALYPDMTRHPDTYTSWLQAELTMLKDRLEPQCLQRNSKQACETELCFA